MKKCLLILVIFSACSEDVEMVYSVDPNLQPYVDTFYSEASERGVVIEKNLVAEIDVNIQSISTGDRSMDQNIVRVSPIFLGLDTRQQEAHIYYRMAQVFLRVDIDKGESFANPDFMFKPYNPVNKEAMFDNLFSDK